MKMLKKYKFILWVVPVFAIIIISQAANKTPKDPKSGMITAPSADFEPDYIVIGSGAGGGVVAARLAEVKSNKVLLIEAGPENLGVDAIQNAGGFFDLWGMPESEQPEGSPSNLKYVTTPQLGVRHAYPRGTGLGGSVNHHALNDGRGSDVIYNEIATVLGDKSWNADSFRETFIAMETYDVPEADKKYHGQKGWLHVKRNRPKDEFFLDVVKVVSENYKFKFRDEFYNDPNNLVGIGHNDIQAHNDGKRSYVTTDLMLPRYQENKKNGWDNFEIATDKLATKIIFEGNKAVGVEVIDGPRAYRIDDRHNPESINAPRLTYRAKKEVILASGPLNTPQLLLLSGIGPAEDLKKLGIKVIKDSPGVGKNVLDHIEVPLVAEVRNLEKGTWTWKATIMALDDPKWKKYEDPEVFKGTATPLKWAWNSGYGKADPANPDILTYIGGFYYYTSKFDPKIFDDEDPLAGSNWDRISSEFGPNFQNYMTFYNILIGTNVNSGTVTINSTDPTQPPLFNPLTYDSDEDLTRMAMAIQKQREILKEDVFKQYDLVEIHPGLHYISLDELKWYIKKYQSVGNAHLVGTAKMGRADDPMAVTDENGKVRGVEGLRVCDASLFPLIPGYNTARPTYALAEIIAKKIKQGN